ncbi:MAG: hypothetical protein Q9222_000802 [Ikaeria aurantiellina]
MTSHSTRGVTRPLLIFIQLTSYLCACQSIGNRINQFQPEWHCNVDSFEYSDDYNDCAKAYDGDDNTFWHTMYTPHDEPLPHRITIDLGKVYKLRGMTYLPRQDGSSNGNIGGWRISLSADEESHRLLNGTWSDDQSRKTVDFDIATPARYFELNALSEAGDRGPWSSAAEINLYEEDDPNAATFSLPTNGQSSGNSSSSSTGSSTTSSSTSGGSSSGSGSQDDDDSSSQSTGTSSQGNGSSNDRDTVTVRVTTTTGRGAQTTSSAQDDETSITRTGAAFDTTIAVGGTTTGSAPGSTDASGSGDRVTSVVTASPTQPSSGGGVATVTASGEGVNGSPDAAGSGSSGAISGKIVDCRIAFTGLVAAVGLGLMVI